MKKVKKLELVIMLLVLLLGFNLNNSAQESIIQNFENNIYKFEFSEQGITQTDETASLVSRMEKYNVPGVSIALINSNKLDWAKAYGVLKNGSNENVAEESIFQAASVSKFVTSLIVLHYVDKGIFDLDTDVNTYLKSWKVPENEYTKQKKITLRYLLSHTSGLLSYASTSRDKSQNLPTLVQYIKGEYPATNPATIPEFLAGDHWAYSNIGYAVVQLILEDTFDKSLNDIAEEVIYKPLELKSTTFIYPLKKELQKLEAYPHKTDGTVGIPEEEMPRAMGGLMTTPSDMAKILIELINTYNGSSEKIISQRTAKQMFTSEAVVPPEALGLPMEMGLGIFLERSKGTLAILHPGHNSPGTVFLIFAIPEKGQGAVIAANGNIGDALYMEIIASLASIYNWEVGQFFK